MNPRLCSWSSYLFVRQVWRILSNSVNEVNHLCTFYMTSSTNFFAMWLWNSVRHSQKQKRCWAGCRSMWWKWKLVASKGDGYWFGNSSASIKGDAWEDAKRPALCIQAVLHWHCNIHANNFPSDKCNTQRSFVHSACRSNFWAWQISDQPSMPAHEESNENEWYVW